jgi:DtxR family Mn-dependent transcriptional regulator
MNKRIVSTSKITVALETYLETIADLQEEVGPVMPSVLAERIGCKRSSVTSALKRLVELGLINYQPYKPVTLSEKGFKMVEKLTKYHNTIAEFFVRILQLPEDFAEEEACKLEHSVSKKVIDKMKSFLDYEERYPNRDKSFKDFLKEIENAQA